ncbi:hypothetical protein [Neptuniibacter sp.]|uniref:hypothetical protein n=1 Tax=Neptuniibacter sp. TaxID=1962643 RepID=UPI002617297F|nr:hypothetical protein [Neptuniibacter sp.]MCP4597071.1 hypothetical protein [Neptuniibacter sp.]
MREPSKKDLKTLEWLLKRFDASEEWCEPYFDRAQRHYKLYRFGSGVSEADWPYVNRTRSRDILAFVEDTTALMVQTLFAQIPFFATEPRETEILTLKKEGIDPIKLADQVSKVLHHQVSHEDVEFFEEMIDFYKGGAMLGNSYLGVYPKWDRDGRYRLPLLKTHDFWNVLPIAGARRVTKSKGVFVREFMSVEDVQTLGKKGIFKNANKVRSPNESSSDNKWHERLLQDCGITAFEVDPDNVETIHYLSGGHVISFADRGVILRDSRGDVETPYPYDMPVVQYKYMPLPLEFFAMGIPEVLEHLQEDKNLIRSARRDNIDLVIQQIIKARQGADINYDLMNYSPGAIWPLENLNDVEPLVVPDVTQSSYQEEAQREHDMENALSFFGYARGMTPQHQEQPTTVMKLQQASMNRLDLAVKMAEFTTLQNIATRVVLLNRRYMEKDDWEAIVGEPDAGFYRLSEEQIRRFFMFKPMGSSVTHIKELRQQQIQAAMDMTVSIPPEATMSAHTPFKVDLFELLTTAYDAIDIKNADRILRKLSPEEVQGMQKQQQKEAFIKDLVVELETKEKKMETHKLLAETVKSYTGAVEDIATAYAKVKDVGVDIDANKIKAYEAKIKKMAAGRPSLGGGNGGATTT